MASRSLARGCLVLAVVLAGGCAALDDSDSDDAQTQQTPTPPQTNMPLVAALPLPTTTPLILTANVPSNAASPIQIPPGFDLGTLLSGSIDFASALSGLTITRTDLLTTPDPTVDVVFGVIAGDDPVGACGGGAESVGTTITGNDPQFGSNSVDPATATLSQTALNIINSGSFSLCLSATSSVDADLILSQIGFAFGFDADCATPAEDLVGRWTGPYTCNDLCNGMSSTEGGNVVIDVVQTDETAMYSDDSGAVYAGSVCGSAFRHFGRGTGYFEYGTLTRTGPTTATKSSTYFSTTIPNCGGTCSDTLTLTPL